MIYDIYKVPNIQNQFSIQGVIKEKLHQIPPIALHIDGMENFQIDILINMILNDDKIRTVVLCSLYRGKLFAIGSSFLRTKLWFIDSSGGNVSQITENMGDLEFLIVSRF